VGSIWIVTFELAFVHQPQLVTSAIIYTIDAIFLIDIWIGTRSSHRDQGAKRGGLIQSLYMRRRLGVVLVGTLPIDILFLFIGANLWGISLVLWFRLFRMIRLGLIFGILRQLERSTRSNTAALRIARLITVVSVVLHLLACIWYLIPFIQEFPPDSWPVRYEVVTGGVGMTYLLSIYWVVTTATTIGFGDIVPERGEEYVFAVVAMLVGASLFAYVIAAGASLISSLNLSKVAFWNRVNVVESYLRSRGVRHSVSEQVHQFYEYLWAHHGGLYQASLLIDLPAPLRLEVMSDLMRDLLPKVPIFRHSPPSLRNELLLALEPVTTQPGGYLVTEGDVADGIYFIAAGTVEVVSSDGETIHARLGAGEYFGDLTLLLGERRSASVRSDGFSEVFRLGVDSFERIKSDYPELLDVLTQASQERSSTVAELVLEGVVL
jgi:voltage-gated potassium channel